MMKRKKIILSCCHNCPSSDMMVKFLENEKKYYRYQDSPMVNESLSACSAPSLTQKLWIYTNFDCNLRCTYCVAKSSPNTARKALGLDNVKRLVDEAVQLGFKEIFLTGGEPFILTDIYEMIAYSSAKLPTTVLTNAMLFNRSRLDNLSTVANDKLTLQVSLDGGNAEDHDAYRGRDTWRKTVEGIKLLLDNDFHIRLSTTETPANSDRLSEICEFHHGIGIPEQDHIVRPLARRGYSLEGIEVSAANIAPELTVSLDGVFWNPLSTDPDMQVSRSIFPLRDALESVNHQFERLAGGDTTGMMTFT